MKSLSVVGLVALILVAGCSSKPAQRLNAPPQGETANPSPLQKPLNAMVTNSAMNDMSVADIHFAGQTAQLSGTGQQRLQRLAQVCKTYGGEVRYDTQVADQKLVQARLERIEQYLASAGCDMDKCSVRLGMAASADMPAEQALKASKAGLPAEESGASSLTPKLPGAYNGGAAK